MHSLGSAAFDSFSMRCHFPSLGTGACCLSELLLVTLTMPSQACLSAASSLFACLKTAHLMGPESIAGLVSHRLLHPAMSHSGDSNHLAVRALKNATDKPKNKLKFTP